MAALAELLGPTLVSASGEVATADALQNKGAVALYFSAHWCPPCRGFTPQLATWYKDHLKAKGLEIVFVSSDRDEAGFKGYFGEMPWTALPYADRQRKDTLARKFGIKGIPSVVLLDGDGKVITLNGRDAISGDPTGEAFPWKPKTLAEILADAKLVGKDGPVSASTLNGKVFALYYSAHWCPPCRGFTPHLAEWYTKSLKAKGLEIIFVSWDRDQHSFDEYYAEQPWLALDFSQNQVREQLNGLFEVEGIPTLILIDKDGSTITTEGREAISADPEGNEFPWYALRNDPAAGAA